MKVAILAFALAFGVTMAVIIGQRMTTDAMAVVLGVAVGAAAAVPVSVVIVWLVRRPRAEHMTDARIITVEPLQLEKPS